MAMPANKKRLLIMTFVVICVGALGFAVYNRLAKPKFEHEGWINCQPSPVEDKEGSELCERARKAGYPYIAE